MDGLLPVDVAHNIVAIANDMVPAMKTLKANLGSDIAHTFTRAKNCPVPVVPRVVTEASTFNGLLAYPAVPGKTVIMLMLGKAAEATGSLFYTFGTGDFTRSCAFKPFFEAFMGDLQKELRARSKQE